MPGVKLTLQWFVIWLAACLIVWFKQLVNKGVKLILSDALCSLSDYKDTAEYSWLKFPFTWPARSSYKNSLKSVKRNTDFPTICLHPIALPTLWNVWLSHGTILCTKGLPPHTLIINAFTKERRGQGVQTWLQIRLSDFFFPLRWFCRDLKRW